MSLIKKPAHGPNRDQTVSWIHRFGDQVMVR